MQHLAVLSNKCKADFLSDKEISDVRVSCKKFIPAMMKAIEGYQCTPKTHELAFHVGPFVQKNRSLGLFCEQASEALHKHFKDISRFYKNQSDPGRRLASTMCALNSRNVRLLSNPYAMIHEFDC